MSDETSTLPKEHPQVGIDAAGNFVVAWVERSNEDSPQVMYRQYTAEQAEFLPIMRADVLSSTVASNIDLAVMPSGEFIITWDGASEYSAYAVYAAQFKEDGSPKALPLRLTDKALFSPAAPVISANEAGDFVVAWEAINSDGFTSLGFRSVSAQGEHLSSEKTLNTSGHFLAKERKASLSLVDNQFVIAWQCRCGKLRSDIFLQRFSLSGESQGEQFQPIAGGNVNQHLPAVTLESSGLVELLWLDKKPLRNLNTIYRQTFAADNIPMNDAIPVHTFAGTEMADSLNLVSDPKDNLHALWGSVVPQTLQRRFSYANANVSRALMSRTVHPNAEKVHIVGVSQLSNPVSWTWHQLAGSEVFINNADQPIANFKAPDHNDQLIFELRVTTADGFVSRDQVVIHVSDSVGAFDDADVVSFEESWYDDRYESLNLVENGDFLGEVVTQVSVEFIEGFEQHSISGEYLLSGETLAIPYKVPNFVVESTTSIYKVSAQSVDGKIFEKLLIIVIENTPSIIPVPELSELEEWQMWAGVPQTLTLPKDPHDSIDVCEWYEIDSNGNPIEDGLQDIFLNTYEIDSGNEYFVHFLPAFVGYVSQDTTITIRRTCSLHGETVQVNDFSVVLKNLPYDINLRCDSVAKSDESFFYNFDDQRANFRTKGCELIQHSGPTLLHIGWYSLVATNVEEEAIVDFTIKCTSLEDEVDSKRFEVLILP